MKNWKDIFIGKMLDFVFGMFGVILCFLFLLSITETSKLNIEEVVSYHKDTPFFHILLFITIFLFAANSKRQVHVKVPKSVLYGIFFLCMAAWIAVTQLYPKADQLQHIAEKNYQDFYLGGYLYSQPHQIFLTYFCAALYILFGKSYVFVFQLLNCIAVLGIYYLLEKMYRRFEKKGSSKAFLILSFLFLPLFFYVTFVYGTIIGLYFSLAAVEFLIQYMKNLRFRYLAACTVCIVFAQLFKSNYLIFFVGILIILLIGFLKEKNFRHIVFIFILVCSLMSANYCVKKITEDMTNIQSNGGVPKILFVAMGLEEARSGPGWWSGYHDNVYLRSGFDAEKSKETGKKKIEERIKKMRKNPRYAASFFLRKLASEWSEPTYESIWIQQDRKSGTDIPELIDRLIHNGGRLEKIYIFYCNIYQSFLYLGALLFVFTRFKKISDTELLIPIIFIGGFLFHTFWEAKGQYTLPYCVCLLPYSISGYRASFGRMNFSKCFRTVLNWELK